jgi:LysM repeat protein
MRILRVSIVLLALPLILSGLVACTAGLEQNPSFAKLAKKVKDLEDGRAQLTTKIEDLTLDVKTVMQDVATVQSNLQNAPGGSAETQKKLAELSDRLQKIEEKLGTTKGAEAASAGEKPKPADAAAARAKTTSVKAAKSRASSVRGAGSSATKGFYYTVKGNETLAGIAAANGVSSAALAKANGLPMGAPLYAGQSIFIPK